MSDLWTGFSQEIPKFVDGVILLGLAGLVGQRLTIFWNLRQKRKENDLATARGFHNLYGEFFATWKLWNYYRRDIGPDEFPQASRWSLLERACAAEGKLESILVRLTCEKTLSETDLEVLGRFRQIYQLLRQCIRDNEPLEWNHSQHPDYVAFKRLAPQMAALIIDSGAAREVSSDQLIEITSNKFEFSR